MKELYILDEPESRGYAYTNHGEVIRKLPEGRWRPATRRERLWFEFRQPRLSFLGIVIGAGIWSVFRIALDVLT